MVRKLFLIAVCFVVFVISGFAVTQNQDTATASQRVDYCLAMNSDGKIETMIAVKPCTPSGWWCTSNSQCCSGRCTNNVCD
ncbi:conotoxin [Thermodesulfovibrio sp. 3907-1M]|uniref:Conotoxin n=1 Tax=Thermodesulfovibrio autotrophicus TaxID=3118333 RepID=A0AAU8GUQ7_9BACT